MAIEAEVTLPLVLTEQEYNLILLFRQLNDAQQRKLLDVAHSLGQPLTGTPVADFLRSIDELRASMTPDEIQQFAQALDPNAKE